MKFYLTTTLPYVNAEPHIGHALEFIQADAIVRYMRQKLGKENVFFNVGTDEHGQKIYMKAKEEGLAPQEFCDKYAQRFVDFCEMFHISYDNFYRTSASYHKEVAQEFRKKSLENNDIYKKNYTGLYCVGCESFKTEKDLIDGKCPDHGKPPIEFSEENYFFQMSKYKETLLKRLDAKKDFLKPATKIQELRNFILEMEDISISRLYKNLPWGVPVPNDSEQVMYVWFDALSNYVGALQQAQKRKRTILIASTNKSKIERYKKFRQSSLYELKSYEEVGGGSIPHIEESGENEREIAKQKAKGFYDIFKVPCIANDTGLYIEGFPDEKQPGKYVKRSAGVIDGVDDEETTYEKILTYYQNLARQHGGKLDAYFKDVYCLYDGEVYHIKEAKRPIIITTEVHGKDVHFPLCSLYKTKLHNKYYHDLTEKEMEEFLEESNAVARSMLEEFASTSSKERHRPQKGEENKVICVQICGPDNLRFQGAVWQAMLASNGYEQTTHLLVHGMILGPDGNKMSKTRGNVVSPFEQLQKYGSEAVRFYLLYGIPTFSDAAYKEEELVNLYNSCLADTYGNLLNRVLHLFEKKQKKYDPSKVSSEFKKEISPFVTGIERAYESYNIQEAVSQIHQLALFANKYITDSKPRDKSVDEGTSDTVLNNLYFALYEITRLYEPIIPISAQKAKRALDERKKIILFEKI